MKKLTKGLFTAVLALGFLAGCKTTTSTPSSETPVVKHLVEFYEDNVGKFYLDVEVVHGEKVAKPADPEARTNYDFDGWWVDEAYSAEFNFDTPIVADTEIFGKWEFNPEYVADERIFHVVGGLENTDLSYINWNASGTEGTDWDVRSYLTKAEDSNLYSIEIEIGYLGKFKVKVPGRPWDSDLEFNYTYIEEEYLHDYLQEGDSKNFQVKTAGLYKIEVETTYLWARVTRLGDAVGAGVKQDPEPGTIEDWGLVGSMTSWGGTTAEPVLDISLKYYQDGEYYFLPVVELPKDAEFKLRADNSWGTEWGSHEDNVLVEGAFTQGTEIVDEVEVIKEGANIKVVEGGFYSVYFDETKLVIRELEFALRGDALVGGWDADSESLAIVGEPEVDETAGTVTWDFSGDYEAVAAKEFKVKFAVLEKFSGWDISFGDGAGNFKVSELGTYTVTLELVYTLETGEFVGTAAFTPVVAE